MDRPKGYHADRIGSVVVHLQEFDGGLVCGSHESTWWAATL